jgi:Ca-activated chloride channel family protein
MARQLILADRHVPAHVIRGYEFVNYYQPTYPSPQSATDLSVVPQLAAAADGTYRLQVGIQAPDTQVMGRRPVNLTLVLDTSGSMQSANPNGESAISLLQASVFAMASALQEGDVVSMVTWNTSQRTRLENHRITGPNDPTLLARTRELTADGGTDLQGGLAVGYELAQRTYQRSWLNRVVLISDGWANVGVTSADLIARHSHNADGEGIYLVGVGVGDGVNDTLMDTVTEKGRGAYVFIDRWQEADRVFGNRFLETLEVAARGVRLEVTLPWFLRLEAFHGEESSTDPRVIEPQHLAPGQAMVFPQDLKPCDAALMDDAAMLRFTATWEDVATLQPRRVSQFMAVGELLAQSRAQLEKGRAVVTYAQALVKAHEAPDREEARRVLDNALAMVTSANPDGADADLTEIAGLLLRYRGQF